MSIHLVWYRSDLRTTDHHPLVSAIETAQANGGGILPIYVVDPWWFGKTGFGFNRTGGHRVRFLRDTLVDLQSQIRDLGSRLAICCGPTSGIFESLLRSLPIQSLHFEEALPPEEQQIEQDVIRLAKSKSINLYPHQSSTLLDIDQLPFEIHETPELFTKFRHIVEKKCDEPQPLARPDKITAINPDHWQHIADTPIESIKLLQEDLAAADQRVSMDYAGGETNGLRRLSEYLWQTDAIKTYKETRNGMLARDDSSKFSLWLASGCISARQIAAEVRQYERQRVANDSTYWMIFELLWRDYFALMMAKHDAALFQLGGLRGESLPWKTDDQQFSAWTNGTTGFPLIDANMRELSATGFMSNRGRQNVGSFLTKNLGIDWRMGAQWFESLLIDYDPCSNYGNWNYIAGVGNDARKFRWFNTIDQSKRYDAKGDYVRCWCPELTQVPDRLVHTPWKMDAATQQHASCVIGRDYPEPIIDLFDSAEKQRALHSSS